jgi:zinc protease
VSAPPPSLGHEARLLLEDRVELPRLYLSWLSPALFEPGDAEMDLLADVLAGTKTSRLYRSLVVERRVAVDVAAFQSSRELGGFFQVVATAAPGRSLAEVEQAFAEALARLTAEGPTTAEMERGLAQAEAQFIYRLQTVGGFGGKSDQLNAYNVFTGDPGFFERDLARYQRASADGLRRAAATWLRPHARIALSVVPRGRVDLALAGSGAAEVS